MRKLLLVVLGLVLVASAAQAADIQVIPPQPTEDDPVTLELSGRWHNSCVPESPQVIGLGPNVTINLTTPDGPCLAAETEWEERVRPGKLPPNAYMVTVNVDGETVGRTRFTVEAAETELTGLHVPEGDQALEEGERFQFTAVARYTDYSRDVTEEADWRSSDPTVASVSDGRVRARSEGRTTISATFKGERAIVSVKVSSPEPPEFNIEVVPPQPTVGDPVTLVLSGRWHNSCVPQNPEANIIEEPSGGGRIIVGLSTPEGPCLQTVTPWEERVRLGKHG